MGDTCLFCYKKVSNSREKSEIKSTSPDKSQKICGIDISVSILCDALKLSKDSFPGQHCPDHKFLVCLGCYIAINKLNDLLKQLQKLGDSILESRRFIETQLNKNLGSDSKSKKEIELNTVRRHILRGLCGALKKRPKPKKLVTRTIKKESRPRQIFPEDNYGDNDGQQDSNNIFVSKSGRVCKPTTKLRDAYDDQHNSDNDGGDDDFMEYSESDSSEDGVTEDEEDSQNDSFNRSDPSQERNENEVKLTGTQNGAQKLDPGAINPIIKKETHGKLMVCTVDGCCKSFFDVENRDLHIRKKHEKVERPYQCSTCEKAFKSKDSLRSHAKNEQKCQNEINKRIVGPSYRRKQKKRELTHICPQCQRKWRSPTELQEHIRKVHTGETPFNCTHCHGAFVSALKLEFHIQKCHNEVCELKCEYCGKGFLRMHRLKTHLVTHQGEKPYLCEICCKSFAHESHLKFHRKFHDPENENKIKCSECCKTFSAPKNLQIHVDTVHNKDFKFVCQVCGHGSGSTTQHKIHMMNHNGLRPHSCQSCGKSYKTSTALNIHMRSHTGERPFVCEVCQSSFTVRSKLTRHSLIHLKDQNH